MINTLFHKDILSVDQFSLRDLELVTSVADKMKHDMTSGKVITALRGNIMTALFYEPSSRTFGSFITSMQRLGGGIIPIQGVQYSSVQKGETLADTVRTFAQYSDIVVIRHPEVGSARIAADFSDKPVINAGDGVGEHPTQALLDYYTISERFGSPKDIHVALIGDLLNGRTVHSLSKLLSLYKHITLSFISPELLKLPKELLEVLEARHVRVIQSEDIHDVIKRADVLYVTRVQKERFTDLSVYESLKHKYVITPKLLEDAKATAIIMHPLPRVGEISMEVDLDPRAVYITHQMTNGMYVRMALLFLILKK